VSDLMDFDVIAGEFSTKHRAHFDKSNVYLWREGSSSLGIRPEIVISLDQVRSVAVATEENVRSAFKAVGASVLGTLALGPIGLLGGLMFAGKSKDVTFILQFRDGRALMGKAKGDAYRSP
jgi:hypothetical protein